MAFLYQLLSDFRLVITKIAGVVNRLFDLSLTVATALGWKIIRASAELLFIQLYEGLHYTSTFTDQLSTQIVKLTFFLTDSRSARRF